MKIHDLINGCIAMENASAFIYSKFMQLFPKEKDFWEDLFNDEMSHSSFLNDVEYYEMFNGLQISDLPLSISLIEKTLKFVEKISEHIKFNPVSFEDALRIALKIEETMVEIFTNDLISIAITNNESFLEKIFRDERLHVDKIKNMMIKKGYLKVS